MEDSKCTQIMGMAANLKIHVYCFWWKTPLENFMQVSNKPDKILECLLKKMKILQALALLRTFWSSRTEHVLKIQNAFS